MGNDISISVKVSNESGPGLAGVAASLQTLKDKARDAAGALVDMHAAARDVRLTASLDDQTSAGLLSVRRAVQELRDESPVRLTVDFSGDSTQITTAAQAMRDLRTNASSANTTLATTATRGEAATVALTSLKNAVQDVGNSLRTLRGRAAAAAEALGDLRTNALAAAVAMRTLNTRTDTAGTRVRDLSTHTRTLRGDMDDLDGSLTRVGGRMGALRGSLGSLGSSSDNAGGGMAHLASAALSLAPALIPIASSMAPIVVSAGAAGLAVAAFGAALGGQIKGLTDAGAAQQKYEDAVAKSGAASKEAVQAENAAREAMAKLPPATRQAAAALMVAKDAYKSWSDSLAGDTMPVATKGIALFTGTLGKLSPLVKTSSTGLQRMETILAGGMQSPGFDHFIDSVNKLAGSALQKATTGLLHLGEAMNSGHANGPMSEFMAYAKANGPAVGDTLKNLGEALIHLVASASDVGVSMLTVVNVLSKLVSAIPPGALTAMLQLAIALKTVKLAAAGMKAVSAGMTAMAVAVGGMRTAAAGAAGPMAGLTAAIASLSTGAKVALAGTGIGLLVIALGALSVASKSSPPNVDRLTTSLGKLANTGKVSGEAARAYGKDLSTLGDSLRVLARPSNSQGIQQWMTKLISMDSTPVKKAKEDLDGVDKALANMVSGGHADMAAAAFKDIAAAMKKQGLSSGELKNQLGDYKQALVDQAFEQKLAAQSMGLFGDQAIAVQTKLDAQKQSADGLRQSIQALNDVNRAALGGQNAFEAAIDAGTKAIKDNGKALSMHNGQLDLNSEKARNEEAALRGIASSTDEYAASVRDSGGSWTQVSSIYERGHAQIVAQGHAMGLTASQAQTLANRILKMPNKTTFFRGNIQDIDAKIKSAQHKVDSLKQKRKTAVGANKTSLDAQVRAAQRAVDALKQKRAVAIKASNQTGAAVAAARRNIASVHGKTVEINIFSHVTGPRPGGLGFAHGGVVGAAGGGPRSRQTLVGEHGPEIVDIAPGSRVHSNPDTKRMMAGGTAGDSSGQPIIVQLQLDGRQVAEVLIDPLRKKVRNLGGATAAFGK